MLWICPSVANDAEPTIVDFLPRSSPLLLSSPPKLAKLLNPRRESLDGDNWIPLVEAGEYDKWRTFIKRQVRLSLRFLLLFCFAFLL
jgi:hypothetical protein